MSSNPPSDPNLSGAEPVYGPAYTAAADPHAIPFATAPAAGFSARTTEPGPQAPPPDGPSPPYTAPYPPYPSDVPATSAVQPNFAAGLAYFTVVPAIFFLLMEPYKSNRLVRFHGWQSVFFFIAVAAVTVVENVLNVMLPVVIAYAFASVISLVLLAAWLVALVQAFSGKAYQLPWIGPIAAKTADGATL